MCYKTVCRESGLLSVNVCSIRLKHERQLRGNKRSNYSKTIFFPGKRGRISDVFELHRTISQPNFIIMNNLQNNLQNNDPNKIHGHDQGSIFDRPGFGSVAFRQK